MRVSRAYYRNVLTQDRNTAIPQVCKWENHWDCIVPIHEVERATGLKPENIIQNVEILERRGIISEIEVEEEKGIPSCILYPDFESSFPYWNDIREFVKKTGTPIERICCDLDFSVFDE